MPVPEKGDQKTAAGGFEIGSRETATGAFLRKNSRERTAKKQVFPAKAIVQGGVLQGETK